MSTATGPDNPAARSEPRRETPERQDAASDRAATGRDTSERASTERVEGARHDDRPREAAGTRSDRDVRNDRVARDDRGTRDDGALQYDRESVVEREKERYGGVKIGAAFFGWLTATGAVVLLTALVAAIVALVATLTGGIDDAVAGAEQNLQSAGIWGIAVLLVIWFIAFFCGGYVAGRMARFSGVKQGLAVWGWAVVIAVLLAIVGLIAGQNFALPAGTIPMMPVPEGQAMTAAIVSGIAVAVVTLIGAILGGLAGMRFHRKVDRAGLGLD